MDGNKYDQFYEKLVELIPLTKEDLEPPICSCCHVRYLTGYIVGEDDDLFFLCEHCDGGVKPIGGLEI